MRKRKVIEEEGDQQKKEYREMPQTWAAIKRSLRCVPEVGDVHNPVVVVLNQQDLNQKILGGNGRNMSKEKRRSRSSLSNKSGKLLIDEEVRWSNSRSENQIITKFVDGGGREGFDWSHSDSFGSGSHGQRISYCRSGVHSQLDGYVSDSSTFIYYKEGGGGCRSFKVATCLQCGKDFTRVEIAEEHHLTHHSVTEVVKGGTSWEIINKIVRSSWSKSGNPLHIIRILKLNHLQTTLAQFEEHRELIKIRANRFSKEHYHPRCLADGNEVMRFHATTVSCSLGHDPNPQHSSSSSSSFSSTTTTICMSDQCRLCCIIRDGFKTEKIPKSKTLFGVFTASTSENAFITTEEEEIQNNARKALIVCRVIAGRVHKPIAGGGEYNEESVRSSRFDSIAGKLGLGFTIEQLCSPVPSAVLPCFVVICET